MQNETYCALISLALAAVFACLTYFFYYSCDSTFILNLNINTISIPKDNGQPTSWWNPIGGRNPDL